MLLEQDDLRLQTDDDVLLTHERIGYLLLEMVYEVLLRSKLGLTLLVVDPQVLVLNLQLVEQVLNLPQM